MPKKKNEKKQIGSVFSIITFTIIIIIVTTSLYLLGFEGSKTSITNSGLETSLVTLKNILTLEGISYLLGNVISNLKMFEPIVLLIIALIGISICESSGLFKIAFSKLKRKKTILITAIVLFLSILSSLIGNYSYVLLMPLSAILYRNIGRHPILGVITAFLGITIGTSAGLIFSYDDYSLGLLTQSAAILDVDKTYIYNPRASLYIIIASFFILLIFGSKIIEIFLTPKFKKIALEEDELAVSKKGLFYTNIVFLILIMLIIYAIIPGFRGSGFLLDNSQESYIAKLFSPTSPFKEGIVFLILVIMMICGYVYGKISGNIKTSVNYVENLSASFSKSGYILVLLLFTSIMISVIDYTNIGEVVTVRVIDFLSTLPFSGLPLIIVTLLIIILLSILVPDSYTKWILISPLLVPLFMKANITPDFTQFIFRVGDSLGKVFTPIFPYFIVMVGFIDKYKLEGETFTLKRIYGLISKPALVFMLLWIIILLGWYIVGLPIGVGMHPAL